MMDTCARCITGHWCGKVDRCLNKTPVSGLRIVTEQLLQKWSELNKAMEFAGHQCGVSYADHGENWPQVMSEIVQQLSGETGETVDSGLYQVDTNHPTDHYAGDQDFNSSGIMCMEHKDNWGCTRSRGHTGLHVAHSGSDRVCYRWAQEPVDNTPAQAQTSSNSNDDDDIPF